MWYLQICHTNKNLLFYVNFKYFSHRQLHQLWFWSCDIFGHMYCLQPIRHCRTRINEHLLGVKTSPDSLRNISGISRHFRDVHQGDITHIQVIGIERVFWQKKRRGLAQVGPYEGGFLDSKTKHSFPYGIEFKIRFDVFILIPPLSLASLFPDFHYSILLCMCYSDITLYTSHEEYIYLFILFIVT